MYLFTRSLFSQGLFMVSINNVYLLQIERRVMKVFGWWHGGTVQDCCGSCLSPKYINGYLQTWNRYTSFVEFTLQLSYYYVPLTLSSCCSHSTHLSHISNTQPIIGTRMHQPMKSLRRNFERIIRITYKTAE